MPVQCFRCAWGEKYKSSYQDPAMLRDMLTESARRAKELKALTNEQLAKLIMDSLWPDAYILSPEADLLEEVMRRLDLARFDDEE